MLNKDGTTAKEITTGHTSGLQVFKFKHPGDIANVYDGQLAYYRLEWFNPKHKWEFCEHCDHDVVICSVCGNNTCNAGHGTFNGLECTDCESAYTLYLNKMNKIK